MQQYLDLCQRIVDEGVWVENARTNTRVKTIINADFVYDVDQGKFPMITTRKAFYKSAIGELLGYLNGCSDAMEFKNKYKTPTWFANANENIAWLNNPHRKGQNDMGRVYGVQGRDWTNSRGQKFDQLKKIVEHLCAGVDDRGEILTFWNPGEFDQGCLRPCMYEHQFSLLGDTLYLNSTQRSVDVPLGLVFNQIQVYTLLALMAQITGKKPGKAYHKLVNAHIYENQMDLMINVQLKRKPLPEPKLIINPNIKSLNDIQTWVTPDDFKVEGYQHHDPIEYPFSV
jgi:thymidylate synthase